MNENNSNNQFNPFMDVQDYLSLPGSFDDGNFLSGKGDPSNFLMFNAPVVDRLGPTDALLPKDSELHSPFMFNEFTSSRNQSEESSFLDEITEIQTEPDQHLIDISEFTDRELQDHIQKHFDQSPSSSDPLEGAKPILRFLVEPPKRVHATSPSKLTDSCRPGGSFNFTVQLVIRCTDGKFREYLALENMNFTVKVHGRSKNGQKSEENDHNKSKRKLVPLTLNPIGKQLLVQSDNKDCEEVKVTMKKGTSIAKFSKISITCGSNAARSKKAPVAARDWDWDYFLCVECLSNTGISPLTSEHITTDSNRSQTREKRKRDSTLDTPFSKRGFFSPFPPPQVQRTIFPASYTQPIQPFNFSFNTNLSAFPHLPSKAKAM